MPKFFGDIDLNKNKIKNATIQPLAGGITAILYDWTSNN